jgi:hypothetical protein
MDQIEGAGNTLSTQPVVNNSKDKKGQSAIPEHPEHALQHSILLVDIFLDISGIALQTKIPL